MLQPPIVVCVDDDASVREAVGGLLQAFGFEVATFASAEAFLEDEKLGLASCLVADVKLGGISGLQLQKRLAAMGHSFPTIFITAYSDEECRLRAIEAGAVAFLFKPIEASRLIAAIRLALGHEPP